MFSDSYGPCRSSARRVARVCRSTPWGTLHVAYCLRLRVAHHTPRFVRFPPYDIAGYVFVLSPWRLFARACRSLPAVFISTQEVVTQVVPTVLTPGWHTSDQSTVARSGLLSKFFCNIEETHDTELKMVTASRRQHRLLTRKRKLSLSHSTKAVPCVTAALM